MRRQFAVTVFLSTLLMIGCGSVPPLTPTPPESIATAAGGTDGHTMATSSVACRGGKSVEYWAAHIAQITFGDLDVLMGLPLKNANGSRFQPTDQSLRSWLKNGSGAVDLYGLSVQLAAATLNVLHGFVDVNATAVLVQQAQIQLTITSPSPGWTQELVREFERCQ